jgi:hypothetical protein
MWCSGGAKHPDVGVSLVQVPVAYPINHLLGHSEYSRKFLLKKNEINLCNEFIMDEGIRPFIHVLP